MFIEKCYKCKVNPIKIECRQCHRKYCGLCSKFEDGLCENCVQSFSVKIPHQDKINIKRPPTNIDDYKQV